jgi:hypothetical protein
MQIWCYINYHWNNTKIKSIQSKLFQCLFYTSKALNLGHLVKVLWKYLNSTNTKGSPLCDDHWYVPRPKIKLHPKNVWQSFENPLAHPICINHLWPKCSHEEFLCLKKSMLDSKTCIFYTLTIPTRANWVEGWSKARIISFIGPIMWISSSKDGKM